MVKTEHSTQHVALVAAQKLNLSECSLLFSSNDVVLDTGDRRKRAGGAAAPPRKNNSASCRNENRAIVRTGMKILSE